MTKNFTALKIMITKSLKDLSLNISEEEYRELPELSYSALARYEKNGFSIIPHLYDKVEGEALTFGSMVDTIITEGMEKFNEKFAVADYKLPSDALVLITQHLFANCSQDNFDDVSDAEILEACASFEYSMRLKDDTKVAKVRKECTEYYNSLKACVGKTIVSDQTYQEVLATVGALKNSPQSAKYLQQTNEEAGVEFLYQQKFRTEIDGLPVKCMFDLLIINHNQKIILPIDLKTTSVPEYDFQRKFIENRYDIQSRLYYRILSKLIAEDEYFKDFKISDFRFLVVNKDSLTPMLPTDEKCSVKGDFILEFKSGYKKLMRDPITIGLELKKYLDEGATVPDDLDITRPIKIYERINNTW